MKLEVGQKVWVKPSDYSRNKEIKEAVITKVGRKYFIIDVYPNVKFDIISGIEENNVGGQSRAFTSLQDILDIEEHQNLSKQVRSLIGQYGSFPCSLTTLRKVYELLNNEKNK